MEASVIESPAVEPAPPLVATCRPLVGIDFTEKNWDKIAAAFADATPYEFAQTWRKKLHSHFAPGVVKAAWTPENFWVYAELTDIDIYNEARELNEDTYQLGDTLEVFIRPGQAKEYFELHVSPDNQHLQLFYPKGKFPVSKEECAVYGTEVFFSRVLVEQEVNRWRVFGQFPVANLNGGVLAAGDEWKVSFSRYDYTRGEAHPVLSSCSPHHRSNFHDVKDWGTMHFEL